MPENRVLIIDDDARICRIIKRVAGDLGIECLAIDNPELFEATNHDFKPNVIFMDLQMPKVDGVELLRKLAEQHSSTAIILVSGMDRSVIETTEELGKSFGLNMAGILKKPVDVDEISSMLLMQFEAVPSPRERKDTQITKEELAQAIERKELLVHYQPQVNLKSGKVVGFEALVRWQHPDHGLLFPDVFIPLAEQHEDLIGPLTFSVLDRIFEDEMLQGELTSDLAVSVNLSATMLSDLSLPDRVANLFNDHSVGTERLMLEVTESGAMQDPSLTMDILTRLRLKNIKLSLDDFGTGFSSMVQLYRLPFTEIKVDKSFVMVAMHNKEAAAIARITIELGHSLDLEVVAEGIEDQETQQWLKGIGCDIGQGYHISRPVAAEHFITWLQDYNKKNRSKTS